MPTGMDGDRDDLTPEEVLTERASGEAEPMRPARRLIAVGSGKGGAGKSLVAANLGVYLAQLGKRVVLLDADLGGANLHAHLGIARPLVTLNDYFNKRVGRLEDCVQPTLIKGLTLVSAEGESTWSPHPRTTSKSRLLEEVCELEADYLICDLPPGVGFTAIDFFILAEVGVLVVVPEPTAVENTYRFIKSAFLRKMRWLAKALPTVLPDADRIYEGGLPAPIDLYRAVLAVDPEVAQRVLVDLYTFRPRIIINQARTRADQELGPQLFSAARRRLGLNVDYFGHIENDDAAWLAVRKRRPLVVDHPEAKASKNIERLARRLLSLESERVSTPVPPRTLEEQTYYEVMEIDPGASEEEIRRAYKRVHDTYTSESMALCGLYTPAQLGQLEHRIEEAYNVLLTPDKRRRYDVDLFPEGTRPTSTAPREPATPGVRADDTQPRLEPSPLPEITADTEFTGELLRRIRESRGIDLLDIAQRTKIGVPQLRAIEDERWDLLPAVVYVRGFLVELARCLRLEPARVTKDYLARLAKGRSSRDGN